MHTVQDYYIIVLYLLVGAAFRDLAFDVFVGTLLFNLSLYIEEHLTNYPL